MPGQQRVGQLQRNTTGRQMLVRITLT
jgi:hypothetical protein